MSDALPVVVVLDSQMPGREHRRRSRAPLVGDLIHSSDPLTPEIIHSRFGRGPDGRAQIGSTPAGGGAGTTGALRE
jgi:hypothetical protein